VAFGAASREAQRPRAGDRTPARASERNSSSSDTALPLRLLG